jgi:hypothetical protein
LLIILDGQIQFEPLIASLAKFLKISPSRTSVIRGCAPDAAQRAGAGYRNHNMSQKPGFSPRFSAGRGAPMP